MKRSTMLLIILGAVLVVVAWFFLFISPRQGELGDIQDEIDTAEATAQGLRGEKAALLAIRDSELTYRRASAELERSIPVTPELAEFIEDVNLLADETGVDLAALNPGLPEAVEGVPFQVLPVQLNVSGQFFEVLGFLYGLEDLERLIRVDALALIGAPDESGITVIDASISGRIFTLATDLPTPELAPAGTEEEEQADTTTTTTIPAEGDGTDTTTTTVAGAAGDGSDTDDSAASAGVTATSVGGDS